MSDLVGNPEDRFSRAEAHMFWPSYSNDCVSSSALPFNISSVELFIATN